MGTTVQAWIDGGASTPEVEVTIQPSTTSDGLFELSICHTGGDFSVTGILLDVDSLRHLLNTVEDTAPVLDLKCFYGRTSAATTPCDGNVDQWITYTVGPFTRRYPNGVIIERELVCRGHSIEALAARRSRRSSGSAVDLVPVDVSVYRF